MFNSLFKKLETLTSLPLSRKLQYFENAILKIKGIVVYRFLFKEFGKGSILRRPLFISYESVEVGDNVLIWDDSRIEAVESHFDSDYKPMIVLGDGVTIQQRCHITAAGKLDIGSGSTVLFDVMITDIDHEYQNISMPVSQQPLLVAKTTIGDNCFIGSGAKINAGTTLGKHCIVGSNAIVRGDFPDYCVIVGMPAKIVKRYDSTTKSWLKTNSLGDFI